MLPKRVGVAHLFGFEVVLPRLERGTHHFEKGLFGLLIQHNRGLGPVQVCSGLLIWEGFTPYIMLNHVDHRSSRLGSHTTRIQALAYPQTCECQPYEKQSERERGREGGVDG